VPGAVANRVALEACVQARNEGRDLGREGNEIIRTSQSVMCPHAVQKILWVDPTNQGCVGSTHRSKSALYTIYYSEVLLYKIYMDFVIIFLQTSISSLVFTIYLEHAACACMLYTGFKEQEEKNNSIFYRHDYAS
jgi:hypothetical protein